MQYEFFSAPEVDNNNHYTKKISVPQYLPSNVKPDLKELCSTSKYAELVRDIKASNVSEEEKQFLIKAASRHIVFNYDKIADYYAHSDKEMQELMEKSALVLIDFDDAIANGYVKLSTTIKNIVMGNEHEN